LSPECGTALAFSLLSQQRKREAESLMTHFVDCRLNQSGGHRLPLQFSRLQDRHRIFKEHDFQSAIANRKSAIFLVL